MIPPTPLWNFSENSSVLAAPPVPKDIWQVLCHLFFCCRRNQLGEKARVRCEIWKSNRTFCPLLHSNFCLFFCVKNRPKKQNCDSNVRRSARCSLPPATGRPTTEARQHSRGEPVTTGQSEFLCIFVFLYLCLFIILTAPVSLPPLLVCAIPILQSYMLHIYMFQLLLFCIHLSFVWTFLALRCSVLSCWKTKKFATNHSGSC